MRKLVAVIALAVLAVFPSRRASAEPWFGLNENRTEDLFADGDLDEEDLAAMGTPRRGVGSTGLRGMSWLSLVGHYGEFVQGKQEWGAVAVVGIALDKIASGDVHRTREVPEYLGDDARAQGAGPSPPAPPKAPAGAPPPAPPPPPPPPEAPADPAVLAPPIARRCVSAALHAAGLGDTDARIDSMISRSRASAALPEVRVRVMRTFTDSNQIDTLPTDTTYYNILGANTVVEARMTWRFDRLLYADDEPSLERARLERQDARTRLSVQVLRALFEWQRAAADAVDAVPGSRERVDARLREAEAVAMLDVLTAGWFSGWRAKEAASK